MKIYCLGPSPLINCFAVKFKECFFLLDCGIDIPSMVSFLPQLEGETSLISNVNNQYNYNMKQIGEYNYYMDSSLQFYIPQFDMVDIDKIDFIVISNFYNIGALPYLTEYLGFKGKIFATEPTIQFGKQMLLELIEQIEKVPQSNSKKQGGFPFNLGIFDTDSKQSEIYDYDQWKKPYSKHDIIECFSKIRKCSFDEDISLYQKIKIFPVSSGYCLGSAYWVIQTDYEKICFISHCGSPEVQLSHSRPLNLTQFKNCNSIIISDNASFFNESNIDVQFANLCNNIGITLMKNGNVILPVHSAGIILDFFHLIGTYIQTLPISRAFMYFISPIAESVLSYADISAEWLKPQKQEEVYRPEMPFKHSEYLESGKLALMDSFDENTTSLVSPCIVFVGSPTLRFGDIIKLINMWKNDSKNSIIFTDPTIDYKKAIEPFKPYNFSVINCPVNLSLHKNEMSSIIGQYHPNRIIVPENKFDLLKDSIPETIDILSIDQHDVIKLDLQRKFERGYLSNEIAMNLKPIPIGGMDICYIKAEILNRDGELTIVNLDNEEVKDSFLWGRPSIENVISCLESAGIYDIMLSKEKNTNVIEIPSLQSRILFQPHKSIIETKNENSISILKNIFVKSLFQMKN